MVPKDCWPVIECEDGHPLLQGRGTFAILAKATSDYVRHGWPFVEALILPILLTNGGCYVALVAAFSSANPDNGLASFPLILFGFIALSIGFWQLIVYFASLNRSYSHFLAEGHVNCTNDYQQLLAQHKKPLIWYINALILIQIISFIIGIFAGFPLALFLPQFLIFPIIQIIMLAIFAWASLGFQVIGLNCPKSGPFGVIKQSVQLVSKRYWKCVFLLLVSLVVTYYVIPGIIVFAAEWSGAINWVNKLHQPFIADYLEQLHILAVHDATLQMALSQALPSDMGHESISHQISQVLLTNIINTLLLPWGTFVYALLYGDLKHCPAHSAE